MFLDLILSARVWYTFRYLLAVKKNIFIYLKFHLIAMTEKKLSLDRRNEMFLFYEAAALVLRYAEAMKFVIIILTCFFECRKNWKFWK